MLCSSISLCGLQLFSHEQYPAAALTLHTFSAGWICRTPIPPFNPKIHSPYILRSSFCPCIVVVHSPQLQQPNSLSCRDWYLLCTISPFLYSIYCICLGEAQYCIQELILLNKRPVCLYDYWTSHKGIKGKGFKEWPWCTVLYFACRSDSLLLLWTKLPNNWTSYQPWGTWAAQAQETSVTQKSNFLQFLSNVSSTMWLEMCHIVVCLFKLLLWMNEGYDNTATCTEEVGGVWSLLFNKVLFVWQMNKQQA